MSRNSVLNIKTLIHMQRTGNLKMIKCLFWGVENSLFLLYHLLLYANRVYVDMKRSDQTPFTSPLKESKESAHPSEKFDSLLIH